MTGNLVLVLTLLHPVVVVSLDYGVFHGLTLVLLASAGAWFDADSELMRGLDPSWRKSTPMLMALAFILAAALFARPVRGLRNRLALIAALADQLDPRRGLEPIAAQWVSRLHTWAQADLVALVLPSELASPAMIASREDGNFRATAEVHERLESLLSGLPHGLTSHQQRSWWDPRASTRAHADLNWRSTDALAAPLAELCQTLGVRSLHVVPLASRARAHGHLLLGYARSRSAACDMTALDAAARELVRILEQAALVDQLQEEGASRERARVGRDLHDSAIQPYLGLKFAVEAVALRIPRDNPASCLVNSLVTLVNQEVTELRELISALRTGNDGGENVLAPAMRRQIQHFAELFGIQVELDCPPCLLTTRVLASAMLHMVNEALNNIRKHTPATQVWITLSSAATSIQIVIRDNGVAVQGRTSDEFCPTSLTERATELGGSLHLARLDGRFTELVIQIPT